MQHAVERAEAPAGVGDDARHLLVVGHVGRRHHHLGAERLELLDLADLAARRVVLGVVPEPGRPFFSGG